MRIRDVAARVGYRQPSQFAKAFRRQYGMTPALFREQHAPDWGMALRSFSGHACAAVAGSGAYGSQPFAATG